MKKWLVVLVMVMVLLVPVAQAEEWESCEQRDICWEGQPCICDYPWLIPIVTGIISVDVTCEDGTPAAERIVTLRRDLFEQEREKITNTNGNVKFLTAAGKYIVNVEGEDKEVKAPLLFLTRKIGFDIICYTTTVITTTTPPKTTTTTASPSTIPRELTSTTTIAGVPHTTTIYHPGKGTDRPVTTSTTSVPEEVTTTVTTIEPEVTTTTTIEEVTTTTSCHRSTTTTKKCDWPER
jgi:hypothetical protein